MKWTKISKPSEVKLAGVSVELEHVDNSLASVKITDAFGNSLLVRKDGWNDIHACIPTPPKTEKRWVLTGKVNDIEIKPTNYETKAEADNAAAEFPDRDLVVTEQDVVIDDI